MTQEGGKATGIVTTNRVTDARWDRIPGTPCARSPAGAYAHVAYRGWEDDQAVEDDGEDSLLCDDIAEQVRYKNMVSKKGDS